MQTIQMSSEGRLVMSAFQIKDQTFFSIILSAVTLLGLGSTQSLLAQSPNELLRQQQGRDEVIRQKIAADMKSAFSEADRLEKTSPARAIERLQRLKVNLDNQILLSDTSRAQYRGQIDNKINGIQRRSQGLSTPSISPERKVAREQEVARLKSSIEEYHDVRRSLDTISALQAGGSLEQAKREIDALQKKYPNNPTVIALNEKANFTQKLSDAKVLQAQQSEGYRLAMLAVDKASVPISGDIEFDTIKKGYFKEITKRRMKSTLTAKEKEILKALEKPINVTPGNQSFETLISTLSDQLGLPILLEKNSLKEVDLDPTAPVTSPTLRNVSGRSALRKILQDYNLTYIIEKETLQVVSIEKARESMITRVYYIGDIVNGVGTFGNAVEWGPQLSMLQAMENAQTIIKMIEKIDVQSWRDKGGSGTAVFHPASMSIIVRQTAEVHGMLWNSFGNGR